MLTFTTTEPGFMGTAGSGPLVPVRHPEVVGTWRNVYLHGTVQDVAGYDIPVLVDGLLSFKTEQPCQVELPGEAIECVLVAWKTCRRHKVVRGLIVARNDLVSLDYARRCQKERRTIL